MKYLLSSVLAISLFAADAGSPLLSEMNAIAQRQLKERANAIAAIRDVPSAEKRKTAVRAKILSLTADFRITKGR